MLTEDQLKKTGMFDPTTIDNLRSSLPGSRETVSVAGNINLAVYCTYLTVSGTMAFTLPDGTVAGQRKKVVCDSAASIPAATLTVTTPETATGFACASSFVFDTAGQAVEFEWTGTKWRAIKVDRAGTSGADGVVVGTTVLTGKNLWKTYCLSVTASVSSTGTKAFPNGSAIGEHCTIAVTTAASIPSGTLDGAYTVLGAAKTHMTNIDATSELISLQWDGVGWAIMSSTLASSHPAFS